MNILLISRWKQLTSIRTEEKKIKTSRLDKSKARVEHVGTTKILLLKLNSRIRTFGG